MTWRCSQLMITEFAPSSGQGRGDRGIRVEALAPLVEGGDVEIGAELHLAGVRRKHTGQHVDQRGLPGAVRTDDADPIAAGDFRAEVAHDGHAAIALGDMPRLDHLPPRLACLLQRQLHLLRGAFLSRAPPLVSERDEPIETAHVALPPRAHAVAEPMLLLHDAPLELVARGLLLVEDRIAPGLEGGEALVEAPRGATIEPDGRSREGLEEAPVVADEHEGRAGRLELGFEALDGGNVEMVGRLVEQEDVGLWRQHAGKSRAPAFAARQPRRHLLSREPETLQEIARAIGIVSWCEPRGDEGAGSGEA